MSAEQPKESYFALNVALSTLSERCQQLQARYIVQFLFKFQER